MVQHNSRITIHMAASLDGYVASKDGDYSWLEAENHYAAGIQLTEQAVNDFLTGIDCYLIGSKTYELALTLGWPYGDKPTIVLTNRPLHTERKNVTFLAGNLNDIINLQLKPLYSHIWMAGGPSLAKDLLDQQLADELVVSIVPVLLGSGTPFFQSADTLRSLQLKDSKTYKNGMVEVTYLIPKTNV